MFIFPFTILLYICGSPTAFRCSDPTAFRWTGSTSFRYYASNTLLRLKIKTRIFDYFLLLLLLLLSSFPEFIYLQYFSKTNILIFPFTIFLYICRSATAFRCSDPTAFRWAGSTSFRSYALKTLLGLKIKLVFLIISFFFFFCLFFVLFLLLSFFREFIYLQYYSFKNKYIDFFFYHFSLHMSQRDSVSL